MRLSDILGHDNADLLIAVTALEHGLTVYECEVLLYYCESYGILTAGTDKLPDTDARSDLIIMNVAHATANTNIIRCRQLCGVQHIPYSHIHRHLRLLQIYFMMYCICSIFISAAGSVHAGSEEP